MLEQWLNKMHPYQRDAFNWIVLHKYCGLFLPPGLGKTFTTLVAIYTLISSGTVDRVLIIAPLRVVYMVWPLELVKWGFNHVLSIGILHGASKDSVIRQKHDIYMINPEGLKWLYAEHSRLFEAHKFMLVVDESTMFKNNDTGRFRLLRKYIPKYSRRLILTGTPAPNGLIQLWSQIYILDMGKRLKPHITHFRNKYFNYNKYSSTYELRKGTESDIFSSVDDIIMHKSNDELDLPDKTNNYITILLPKPVRTMYNDMLESYITELEGTEVKLKALNATARASNLKQMANGIVYGEEKIPVNVHDEKLMALDELVDTLAGKPLLVAYEYNHDLEKLKYHFNNPPHIGGGVSGDELSRIVAKWNRGLIPILLVQPQAGGHGLNLQEGNCCDICWYSITFDLELYMQLNARIHRQGVKSAVTIHHIVAKDTVDERVVKALEGKSTMQDALLNYLLK